MPEDRRHEDPFSAPTAPTPTDALDVMTSALRGWVGTDPDRARAALTVFEGDTENDEAAQGIAQATLAQIRDVAGDTPDSDDTGNDGTGDTGGDDTPSLTDAALGGGLPDDRRITSIMEWVSGQPDRARAALTAELEQPESRQRPRLIADLEAIVAADEERHPDGDPQTPDAATPPREGDTENDEAAQGTPSPGSPAPSDGDTAAPDGDPAATTET